MPCPYFDKLYTLLEWRGGLLSGQPHFFEGPAHGLRGAFWHFSILDQKPRRVGDDLHRIIEIGRRPEVLQPLIPDAGRYVRPALHGDEVESSVGNTTVNMHSPVILRTGIISVHVVWLRVLAQ